VVPKVAFAAIFLRRASKRSAHDLDWSEYPMTERPPSVGDSAAESFVLLNIGGVILRIAGRRRTDLVCDAEHEPFRVRYGPSDIHIRVEWVKNLEPISGRSLFDSGTTWKLYQSDHGFTFDFGDRIGPGHINKRLFVNAAFDEGMLQVSAKYFARFPYAAGALAYPLDELLIMHRLTQEKAIELHGTGIVRQNSEANLFVGHSGAGKSTTTRLWTAAEDVEVLSDDRIIARRDEMKFPGSDLETPIRAVDSVREQEVLRLREDDRRRSVSNITKHKMRIYGTPWHGEAMYASPNSAPLTRIFVLEHGHGNKITPLTPGQAVAELFARSFVPFHRHEYVDSALAFLEELANAVPVYRYAFEPDPRAVEKIRNFHD